MISEQHTYTHELLTHGSHGMEPRVHLLLDVFVLLTVPSQIRTNGIHFSLPKTELLHLSVSTASTFSAGGLFAKFDGGVILLLRFPLLRDR